MKTVSERTFGIELEILTTDANKLCDALNAAGITTSLEGYNHTTRSHWKLVPDISVSRDAGTRRKGIELVSPPLSGEAGLEQIRTVCKVLAAKKATVNKTCGFHVHHAASDLSLNAWKILVKRYITHEGLIDSFLPESRRGDNNRFCRSNRNRFLNLRSAYSEIQKARTLDALVEVANGKIEYSAGFPRDNRRYHKLNLTSFRRHGTVEFRQHSGTIEADKIIAWVVFTQSIIENVQTVRVVTDLRQADSMSGLMRMVPAPQRKAVKGFYTERAAHFATAA